jgi:hypothetical protein
MMRCKPIKSLTEKERLENFIMTSSVLHGNAERQQLRPEEYSKEIDEGAWIIVIDPPNTEYTVEHLSCWYALPDPYHHEKTHRRSEFTVVRYRVRILTPKGPLWLWPHEYIVLKDATELFNAEGVEVHYLSNHAEVDPDHLFFLRQRGIPKQQALMMLIGEVKEQNFCYFTMPEEAQEMFRDVGVPLDLYIHRNPRADHETPAAV